MIKLSPEVHLFTPVLKLTQNCIIYKDRNKYDKTIIKYK